MFPPFIIVLFFYTGISLDDTFIIIGSWRQTSPQKSLEHRIKECLSESALSITITSLTDAVAFSIGIYADFRAVQAFAKACVTAIVFCYLFQLLFFAPCLVFSGKRQMQNRHCWTFRKVVPKPKAESSPYRIFCAGDGGTSENVTGTPAMKFFRDYYGPFLNKPLVTIIVVFGYAAYLGTAMWGYTLLEEGFQERNWVLDDSHLVRYYDLQDQYFTHFGPQINIIATEEVDYSNLDVQKSLEDTINELEASQYTMESSAFTTSWLREYLQYLDKTGRRTNITKSDFVDILRKEFLNHPFYQQYSLDIVLSDRNDSIIASRFQVFTKDMNNKKRESDMMLECRDIAAKSDVPLIAYHANFIIYDQYIIMWPHTLHNLLIAGGAMFIIALFLIPHPVCAIIVTASIASIIIGVLGYMSIWGIPLNHVSMVNLILCVGFSVDFSAHICYSFISAPAKSKRDRVRYALFYLGLPILQGGRSTILACVGTSTTAASSYRIFFKTMFLVITLGMLHGLVFLPVFLKIFIPIRTKHAEDDEKETEKEKEAQKDKSATEKFITTAAVDSEGKKPYIVTKTMEMEGSVYQNGAQLITGQITWTDSKGEQTESKKWTVLQKGIPDDLTKPSSVPLLSEDGDAKKQAPTLCIQPLYDELSPEGKAGERDLSEFEKQLVLLPAGCLSKNMQMLKDEDVTKDNQAMNPLLYGGVPSGDLHHMSVSVKYVYSGEPGDQPMCTDTHTEEAEIKQGGSDKLHTVEHQTVDNSDKHDETPQCDIRDTDSEDEGTNVDTAFQKQYSEVKLDLRLDPNRETRL